MMRILMVDDSEARRETLAAHTGAEVVRVMPRGLAPPAEALAGFDALALGGIDCEGGWAYDVVKDGFGYGRHRRKCPNGFTYDPGWCGCSGRTDAAAFLRDALDVAPDGFRIALIGGADDAEGHAPIQSADRRLISDHWRVSDGEIHVTVCSPKWRKPCIGRDAAVANLRAAFGLPLDFEVTA